jgi:hypothetical protein
MYRLERLIAPVCSALVSSRRDARLLGKHPVEV